MSRGEETREQTIEWTIGMIKKRLERRASELPAKGLCNEMKEKALNIIRDIEQHVRKETVGC